MCMTERRKREKIINKRGDRDGETQKGLKGGQEKATHVKAFKK